MFRSPICAGFGLSVLCLAAPASAEEAVPHLPPLPHHVLRALHDNAAAWQAFRARHAFSPSPGPLPVTRETKAKLRWIPAFSNLQLSNPVLLTDGTVIAHTVCTGNWYRLTPNVKGVYARGTWTAIASMPAGYNPLYFASGVLPDGRVIVEGGEYDGAGCNDIESKAGAIYDPQTNSWTSVAPPSGWTTIGDAASMVLPDGTFLLSDCCNTALATLDATTLAWTSAGTKGKADSNNEENWTLLPNGDVLTVDAYTLGANGKPIACGKGSELYAPGAGSWTSAGGIAHQLAGCTGSIQDFEAPTQVLQPSQGVLAFGATAATTNQPVWTASYSPATKTWASSVPMPELSGQYYTMADAPAAVLPNGEVLIAASPGVWPKNPNAWYPAPTHFFTFDGTSFTQIGDVADSYQLSSFEVNFLVLPSGEVLATETYFENAEILPAVCCAPAGWAPSITAISSTSLAAGGTYSLTGTQLSGLTQGASYGDDGQADTNFPLVRITNTATLRVYYARSFGFTRSVAPGAVSSTSFTLPAGIEAGAASLVVVANGIASAPVAVTVSR
jgi:hypothetical protein